MNTKTMKPAVAAVAAVCAFHAFAYDSLEVAKGETVTISATQTNATPVVVHGTLNVKGTSSAVELAVEYKDSASEIELGPNAGDEGVLIVDNGRLVNANNVNLSYLSIRVGSNGGGDKAVLRTTNWKGNSYLKTFTLAAAANTESDCFEVMDLRSTSDMMSTCQIENLNTKPLVISFAGDNATLRKFSAAGPFFVLTGDGDIVLKSVNGNAITLRFYYGNDFMFFDDDQTKLKGRLRTEGSGDLIIDISFGSSSQDYAHTYLLNAANAVWGHGGDFIVGTTKYNYSGIFKVTADNALPFGAGTGEMVVRSHATDADKARNVLDLAGTTQKVNGLVVENGSVVTNSSGSAEAALVFGDGGVNGRIVGASLTNSAIRCVKTGSGVLTLDGAELNSLSGEGGTVYVASKTYVGTLALTNCAVSFADGDASLLTVGTSSLGAGVTVAWPDGAATNCVFLKSSVLPGAEAVVKAGPGFVTYATPADAQGMPLEVRGGVLRMGGESCTNEWWRIILKKARNNGKTYTYEQGGKTWSKFISVGIGTLGMFNDAGVSTIGSLLTTNAISNSDDAAQLVAGCVMTNADALAWSQSDFSNECVAAGFTFTTAEKDPILRGGSARTSLQYMFPFSNTTSNSYDLAATNTAASKPVLGNYADSVIFGGAALDPEDESTWKIVTWRTGKSGWPKNPASYALQRTVNWGAKWDNDDNPCLTDWEIQSSPSGESGTWTTMDERSGQRWWGQTEAGSSGLHQQYQYTYNNHIPYLFRSRNADWRFTTFGAVSVSAGATLDLSELRPENIAFNGLSVDVAAGAGTITHFAPAANGTLYVTGLTAEQLANSALTLDLPLTIGEWVSGTESNLDTWSVRLNGLSKAGIVVKKNDAGGLTVRHHRGLILIFR